MSDLADRSCKACSEGGDPLTGRALAKFEEQLSGEWTVEEEHHLVREFSFDDFQEALAFTNIIGEIAEEEFHHPNIHLTWGTVRVRIWTHEIDGLSEADFVLAAKFEEAYRERFGDG